MFWGNGFVSLWLVGSGGMDCLFKDCWNGWVKVGWSGVLNLSWLGDWILVY